MYDLSVRKITFIQTCDMEEIKRTYIDLMESNDFTYKEYDEYKLLRVDKHSFGHCCI